MQLRVIIIDPSESMREALTIHIENLGHEVIATSNTDLCPHYSGDFNLCSQENACGDAILLGQELQLLKGIEFIERRLKGGCKGAAANNALICRPWSFSEECRAKSLGCRFFETPIKLSEITDWLREVENNTSPDRQLAVLHI